MTRSAIFAAAAWTPISRLPTSISLARWRAVSAGRCWPAGWFAGAIASCSLASLVYSALSSCGPGGSFEFLALVFQFLNLREPRIRGSASAEPLGAGGGVAARPHGAPRLLPSVIRAASSSSLAAVAAPRTWRRPPPRPWCCRGAFPSTRPGPAKSVAALSCRHLGLLLLDELADRLAERRQLPPQHLLLPRGLAAELVEHLLHRVHALLLRLPGVRELILLRRIRRLLHRLLQALPLGDRGGLLNRLGRGQVLRVLLILPHRLGGGMHLLRQRLRPARQGRLILRHRRKRLAILRRELLRRLAHRPRQRLARLPGQGVLRGNELLEHHLDRQRVPPLIQEAHEVGQRLGDVLLRDPGRRHAAIDRACRRHVWNPRSPDRPAAPLSAQAHGAARHRADCGSSDPGWTAAQPPGRRAADGCRSARPGLSPLKR